MKRCSRCNEEKSLDLFGVDRSRLDGKHNRCKQCNAERDALYRTEVAMKGIQRTASLGAFHDVGVEGSFPTEREFNYPWLRQTGKTFSWSVV